MRFGTPMAFIHALKTVVACIFAIGLVAPSRSDDLTSRLAWAVQLGGTGDVQPKQMITDSAGNTYVCGSFTGVLTVDGNTFLSTGDNDAFIAKFALTGRLLWARVFGSSGLDYGAGVSLTPAGGVVVAGGFSKSVRIGAQVLTASGASDWFAVKYASDGTPLWAKQGGTTFSNPTGVFVDPQGYVYMGAVNALAQGQLSKFTTDGQPIWNSNTSANRPFGTDGLGRVYCVDQDGMRIRILKDGVLDSTIGLFAQSYIASAFHGAVSNGMIAVVGQLQSPALSSYLGLFQTNSLSIGTDVGDTNAALTGIISVPGGFVAAGHDSQFFFKLFDNRGSVVQTLRWGSYLDSGIGVGIDDAGFGYEICRFIGDLTVGPKSFRSEGGADAVLIKFASGVIGAITRQPQSKLAAVGENVVLDVAFSTLSPTTYQWRKNGLNIASANSSVLALTSVQLSTAGVYDVVIQSGGKTFTSDPATLTVDPPPIVNITSPKSGATIGRTNTGTVVAVVVDARDDGFITNVALFIDGSVYGNLTQGPYSFSPVINSDGTHFIAASATDNLGLTRFSPTISVNLGLVPTFTRGLTNVIGIESSGITLDTVVQGTAPLSLQWFKDGTSLAAQNAIGLALNNLLLTDAGDYTLRATNLFGTASTSAHLTVDPLPTVAIIFPPNGAAYERGTNIIVGVRAEDDGSVTNVTLFADGVAVGSKNSGPFTLRFDDENSHVLTARATDNFGASSTSLPVTVRVGHRPTQVRASNGLSVPAGVNVELSAHFDGTAPIFYQWLKEGNSVPGANASTLVLTNVVVDDSGNYNLIATNLFGVASTEPVSLVVTNADSELIKVSVGARTLAASDTDAPFTDEAAISLDSIFEDGLIFFTLDGTTPDFSSRIYTGPFTIRNSAILRALAYNGDLSAWAERAAVTLTRVESAYTLQTAVSGGGIIIRDVPPVDGQYASNSVVRLAAASASGWSFLGWSGDSVATAGQIVLTMNRAQSVQAIFGTPLTLRVSGSGDVIANPLVSFYPYGSRVRLAAIPEAGNYFALWGGAAAGLTNNPLELQITNAQPVVSALFAPLPGGQVVLSVNETGEGTVTIQPTGNRFAQGTVVTLNAAPGNKQNFLGWSGDATGTNNPLRMTLTNSKAITARFTTNQFLSIGGSSLRDARSVTVHVQSALGAPLRLDASTDLRTWIPFLQTNALGSFDYIEAMTNGAARFFELK